MKEANWLLGEITSIFGSAIWDFISSGLLCGLIGLIVGIILVWFWNKRKAFDRSNMVWSFLAKINLIYIPILFTILFGAFASVFSIQNTANKWIGGSVSSIQEYAVQYVPEVEKITTKLIASTEKTEEVFRAKITERAGLSNNSMGQAFFYWLNRNVISFMLSKLGYSDDINGLIKMVEEKKIKELNARFFDGISSVLQDRLVGSFFGGIYISLFWAFFPFILIPVGEYLLFILLRKRVERT
jgi:hypothetical protein